MTAHVLVANPSGDVYGSDLQMLESVEGFTERGWKTTVMVTDPGPLVSRLERAGATVLEAKYPVLRRAYASPLGLLRLAAEASVGVISILRRLRELRPDIVYVNTLTLPWWLLASRVAGIPVLCHVHEAESTDSRTALRGLTYPLILANRVVANGRPAADLAAEILPAIAPRITVVLNGIAGPTEVTEPPPTPPTRLLCVGRLSPRKDTRSAIDATAELLQRGHDVELELCGTNFPGYEWYVEELREAVKGHRIEDRVTFSGYVENVWAAYKRSHIVLAPSLGESLGNAVIEAQFAGRAVVATDVQGHDETVEDGKTGLLVPPQRPDKTADAVARIISDEDLHQKLRSAARETAIKTYGAPRYRSEITDVVESLRRR